MTEQLKNLSISTLVGNIGSGDTSLTVASAAPFSATGNFRINIDNELMLVTGVAGAVFTVTRAAEGTTAASHIGGANVSQVLTVASLQASFAAIGAVGSGVTGTGLWYSTAGVLGAAAVTITGDISPSALSGSNLPLTVATITGSSGTATIAANTTLSGAAGTGGIDGHLMTGAWLMPTGNGSWAGASGKTLSLVSTGAGITITSGGASTLSTSSGAQTVDSAAALNLGTVAATSVVSGNSTTTTAISNTVTSSGTITSVIGSTTAMSLGLAAGDQITLGTSTATCQVVPAGLTFGITAVPNIQQTIAAVNTAPNTATISAQSSSLTSTTGTAANTTGATLVLKGGVGSSGNVGVWQAGDVWAVVDAPSAAGTEAYFKARRVTTTMIQLGSQVGTVANGAIYGPVAPSGTNYSIAITSAGNTNLNGASAVTIGIANGQTLNFTAHQLAWTNAAGAPAYTQTAAVSTSAGNGSAGQTTSITAQAGQAATGAGNNGGNGGNLNIGSGAGGTSGSATAGISGLVSVFGLVGGQGTTPFGWSGQTSPNTVAGGVGGTQTISAAQSIIPFFLLTTGTLTSNVVVDFGTNAVTGYFIIDVSGVGTLGAFTVGFKNGTTTKTITATQLANLVATGATAVQVWTYGTNNITLVS
jgi:hypothetical protein